MLKKLLALSLLASCGHPGDKDKDDADTADATAAPSVRKVAFDLTAEYQTKPIDILIVRESDGRFEEGFFADRLKAAAPTLAARLAFTDLDWQVGFIDAGVPRLRRPSDPPAPVVYAGELKTGLTSFPTLWKGTENLAAELDARILAPRDDMPQMPLTALQQATERAGAADSTTYNFFRPNAFLSVVFIQADDERDEQLLPDDILETLDKLKGPGNYSVSVIAPDWDGCDLSDDWRTNPPEYVRRNLVLRLQKKTGGLFHSLCEHTYAYFFDQLLQRGTGVEHFPVALPEKAMWSSIEVKVGSAAVGGWRYEPGETTLLLPRLIQPGAAVSVAFEADDGTRPNEAPGYLEELSILTEKKLSPEELAFNQEINPILQRSCNGGGCHGQGTSRNRYVDRYKTVVDNRMMIEDYVQRPLEDPLHMPRGASLPQEDYDKLLNWLGAQAQ